MQFIYRTRDKVWDFYEVRILIGAFDTVQGSKKSVMWFSLLFGLLPVF